MPTPSHCSDPSSIVPFSAPSLIPPNFLQNVQTFILAHTFSSPVHVLSSLRRRWHWRWRPRPLGVDYLGGELDQGCKAFDYRYASLTNIICYVDAKSEFSTSPAFPNPLLWVAAWHGVHWGSTGEHQLLFKLQTNTKLL
jgi:hypothetical protein